MLDQFWKQIKEATDGGLITLAERETIVEAWVAKDRQSLGFGYGTTKEEALANLLEKVLHDQTVS
jgi:hypothetical protein